MNVNQIGYGERIALIQAILGEYGLKSEAITPVAYSLDFSWPFNNFIYKVALQSPASPEIFPGTQPGTVPAPKDGLSMFIIRMGNLKVSDLNHTNRVENEVACSALAREATKAAGLGSLVPEIYAWRAPKSLESPLEENFGWSICEFKVGKDLDTQFPLLSAEEQDHVIQQLADIYSALQKAAIPPSVDRFGGITFDSQGNMVSGQTAMNKGGPWATLSDYWTEKLSAIVTGANENSFLQTSGDAGEKLSSRVKRFLDSGGVAQALADVNTTQRCLVHSDFTMNNVLFDTESKKVTALIDFDFASINHPIEEHYFASFGDLGGGLRAVSTALYRCIMSDDFEQQPLELSDSDKEIWHKAKSWNKAIVERNILRPKTLAGAEKVEALRQFEECLSKMRQDKDSFLAKYSEAGKQGLVPEPVAIVTRMLDTHIA
ncbi:hypothetical protein NLG97_g3083 [Lecanicillium saksenae]|uniref:Uncharacterized protein n=1 Tax=Lecanicillium saksenae TaxID=468837 RepID=A0ACC1R0W3_9HYPO|nr:hypothetical protein NLG97_g3083 [Lecanicillium saksenae]